MMIYDTRKEAKSVACGDDLVVKVSGGYIVVSASNYKAWRDQK